MIASGEAKQGPSGMSEVPHRWVGNRDKVTGTKKPEKEEH